MTRSSGQCWSRALWTGRSPAATQAWHQRERTDVLSGDWHLSTSAYFSLYDHVHGPIQPGIQESTEGQGTPAATGHGQLLRAKRLGNNTCNDDNGNNHNINDNKTDVIRNENENNKVNDNDENKKI